MPKDSSDSMSGPLASTFSESATLPYEELQELKAAAAAATSDNGLMVKPVEKYRTLFLVDHAKLEFCLLGLLNLYDIY